MQGGCIAANILEHARGLERELTISLENQLNAVKQLASSRAQSHGMARRVVEAETKLEAAEAENTRLKNELERAIYGCGCDNYLQIYCDKHNPYNKTK